MKDTEVLQ